MPLRAMSQVSSEQGVVELTPNALMTGPEPQRAAICEQDCKSANRDVCTASDLKQ